MDKKTMREILAAHADQLVNGHSSDDYLNLLSERDSELTPLFNVAERVQSTLKPVPPTNEFESELKRQLLTTAHIRQVEGYQPPHPFRDLFLLMAALAFIVSLGMVLLAMRSRTHPS